MSRERGRGERLPRTCALLRVIEVAHAVGVGSRAHPFLEVKMDFSDSEARRSVCDTVTRTAREPR